MPQILLHLLPASLYALLGIHFWRTRWAEGSASTGLSRIERLCLLGTIALHGTALYLAIFSAEHMHFSFAIALSTTLWLAVLFYWVENFYARLDGLLAFVMPSAAISAALPVVFSTVHTLLNASSPEFRAHFVVAMLAYSLFTLAALHALLMAIAERRLHHARLSRALASLPPLLTMERLLFRLIAIAFVLLSLTLLSGILFSETLFGKAFSLNHKTFFAVVSWLLFAVLLLGRHLRGWRGRTALRLTLAGFTTLMLAYAGSRFVVEVILQRSS